MARRKKEYEPPPTIWKVSDELWEERGVTVYRQRKIRVFEAKTTLNSPHVRRPDPRRPFENAVSASGGKQLQRGRHEKSYVPFSPRQWHIRVLVGHFTDFQLGNKT
jgi:hypothetical protein